MQNTLQKFKKPGIALLFSRNQVFCMKIGKLCRAPTILQFKVFC